MTKRENSEEEVIIVEKVIVEDVTKPNNESSSTSKNDNLADLLRRVKELSALDKSYKDLEKEIQELKKQINSSASWMAMLNKNPWVFLIAFFSGFILAIWYCSCSVNESIKDNYNKTKEYCDVYQQSLDKRFSDFSKNSK